jgi:hypothetical protein
MSESLSDWLSLREAADAAARSAPLVERLVVQLPADRPLRAIDLGSGTGSNIRYLAPRLPQPQAWVALDRDPALLAQTPTGVDARALELGVLDDPDLFAGCHLVTASALLDLVSPAWMRRLAELCAAAGAAALFALTYDGRSECDPREPEDDEVRELFNRHQRSNDKGFGRAAGPDAATQIVDCFAGVGYEVERCRSDWRLAPEQDVLQAGLIRGWADAAREVAPERGPAVDRWLARRLSHSARGASRIAVGHVDVAAWPVRSAFSRT